MRELYRLDLGMSSQGIKPDQETYVRTLLGGFSEWVVTYWAGPTVDEVYYEGYFVGPAGGSDNFFINVTGSKILHRDFGPALDIPTSARDELISLCDLFDSGNVTEQQAERVFNLCLALV